MQQSLAGLATENNSLVELDSITQIGSLSSKPSAEQQLLCKMPSKSSNRNMSSFRCHRLVLLLSLTFLACTASTTETEEMENCSYWNINYESYGNYTLKCKLLDLHIVNIQGVEFQNFTCNETEECFPNKTEIGGLEIVSHCSYRPSRYASTANPILSQ